MINWCLKLPIRFWQRFISPWMPPACRFYPNCSAYAIEALDRHPWHRALLLIIWRILRCNPFSAGGFDPVPLAEHQHPHNPPRKAI